MSRVGFDALFSPLTAGHPVCHPTCDVPFPPRRTGENRKGMISANPSYQGVRRSVWDPETFAPGHKAGHMAKRRVGIEYSPSTLEPVRPGAASPDRALYLPTFSHFVIVIKTSFSLFLSLSLSVTLRAERTAHCREGVSQSCSPAVHVTQNTVSAHAHMHSVCA
jgi:hypothetical protein